MSYFYIGATVMGVIIVAAAISYFTDAIKMPQKNKDRITKLEGRMDNIMEIFKIEQRLNKSNYLYIRDLLEKLSDKVDKYFIHKK